MTLVTALSSYAVKDRQRIARRFLQGLSADELKYIAEFLGACILECPTCQDCSREQLAQGIAQFERQRAERTGRPVNEHKMILLLEYLCQAGLTRFALVMRAGA